MQNGLFLGFRFGRRRTKAALAALLLVLGSPAVGQQSLRINSTELPPISSANASTPGFALELTKQVLAEAGLTGSIEILPWQRALTDGMTEPNTVVVPVARLALHEDRFTWIAPLIDMDLTFATVGQPVDTIAQALQLGSIAAQKDSPYEAILRDYGFGNYESIPVGDIPQMLARGHVEAWFTTADEAHWAWKSEGVPQPLRLGKRVGVQRMWLAGSKTLDPGIARRLAETVVRMKADGRFDKIMGAYLAPRPTDPNVGMTVIAVNNRDILVLRSLLSDFTHDHPATPVTLRVVPEGDLRNEVSADIFSGSGMFDVVTIGTYEVPIWAKKGWLRPITDLSGDYDAGDMVPSVMKALSAGGKAYALPFYAESSMTFYRKDLLAKSGISLSDMPTYDEVMAAAKAMHDPARGVYGACLRVKPGWGENMALVSTIVNGNGGRWFDEAWRPQLTTPAWR
jgi:hypothetical protein